MEARGRQSAERQRDSEFPGPQPASARPRLHLGVPLVAARPAPGPPGRATRVRPERPPAPRRPTRGCTPSAWAARPSRCTARSGPAGRGARGQWWAVGRGAAAGGGTSPSPGTRQPASPPAGQPPAQPPHLELAAARGVTYGGAGRVQVGGRWMPGAAATCTRSLKRPQQHSPPFGGSSSSGSIIISSSSQQQRRQRKQQRKQQQQRLFSSSGDGGGSNAQFMQSAGWLAFIRPSTPRMFSCVSVWEEDGRLCGGDRGSGGSPAAAHSEPAPCPAPRRSHPPPLSPWPSAPPGHPTRAWRTRAARGARGAARASGTRRQRGDSGCWGAALLLQGVLRSADGSSACKHRITDCHHHPPSGCPTPCQPGTRGRCRGWWAGAGGCTAWAPAARGPRGGAGGSLPAMSTSGSSNHALSPVGGSTTRQLQTAVVQ